MLKNIDLLCTSSSLIPINKNVNKISFNQQSLNSDSIKKNTRITSHSDIFEYVSDGNGDLDISKILMINVSKNLNESLDELKNNYEKIKKHQGIIGQSWDFIKNKIGLSPEKQNKFNIPLKIWSRYFNSDDGSQKIDKKINSLKANIKKLNELAQNNDIENYEKLFIKLIKRPFNPKTLDELNILKGTVFENAVKKYDSSQNEGIDTIADFAIWIASLNTVTPTLTALAAIPATGGSSLLLNALGITASAIVGSFTNVSLKAVDSLTGGRKYNNLKVDVIEGAAAGVVNPIGDAIAAFSIAKIAPSVGVNATMEFVGKSMPLDVTLEGGNNIVRSFLSNLQSSITWGIYEGSVEGTKEIIDNKKPEEVIEGTIEWTKEGGFYGPIIDNIVAYLGL